MVVAVRDDDAIFRFSRRMKPQRGLLPCEMREAQLGDHKLDAAFNDTRGDGMARQARGVVDIEFPHQLLSVFFDRFDADPKLCGDLFIGCTLGDALQDLRLARR